MPPERCCPHFHRAVELVGRRWTGAILAVLVAHDPEPLRFKELQAAVPDLSDRLLTERVRELEPALRELGAWARRWLAPR